MAQEKALKKEVVVAATVPEVWRACTTVEGVRAFFAPDARIDLSPGGAYEMLFEKPGKDWEPGFDYFDRAWGIVLKRLAERFDTGPVDWASL